ncbi:MAG: hypothetical protein ACRCWG_07050 [Sarcina sp.]
MKVLLVGLSIVLMNFNLGASIDTVKKVDYPIFLGVVERVEKQEGNKGYKVLVDGYIKGGIIKKEKIVALVSQDTKIKVLGGEDNEKINIKRGDHVFIEFSQAMTFSIPPQSFARELEIYKKPTYTNLLRIKIV